jgi:hypothetical protein
MLYLSAVHPIPDLQLLGRRQAFVGFGLGERIDQRHRPLVFEVGCQSGIVLRLLGLLLVDDRRQVQTETFVDGEREELLWGEAEFQDEDLVDFEPVDRLDSIYPFFSARTPASTITCRSMAASGTGICPSATAILFGM